MPTPLFRDLSQVRAAAAAATSVQELRALYRPADRIRKRAALESLSPTRLPEADLLEIARDSDADVRRALIRNPGVHGSVLGRVAAASLRHTDNADAIGDWITWLWDARPDQAHVVRDAIRRAAFDGTDVPGSVAFDVARALMQLDDTLTTAQLLALVLRGHCDEVLVAPALRHPAAGPLLWDAVLAAARTAMAPARRFLLVSLVASPAVEYEPVRRAALASRSNRVLIAFAQHVRDGREACALLTEARECSADESRIADVLPDHARTPEVRALLLSHPDGAVRLERIASLSKGREGRTR